MIALDNDNFRRQYSDAWELYLKARQEFIDSLSLKQHTKFRKLNNKADRYNNMVDYSSYDITKVTKDKSKIALFNKMSDYYDEYKVLARRSELKLVA